MTNQEIVNFVESEMRQFRSCPYCGQYGSLEQHQAGCLYLSAKSAVSQEEEPNSGEPTTASESAGVDVATADVEPLPALTPQELEDGLLASPVASPNPDSLESTVAPSGKLATEVVAPENTI